MKRGFLLKAEKKKAAAKRRGAQGPSASSRSAAEPLQPHRKGSNVDRDNLNRAEKLAYGNLNDEQKALPSDYDLNSKSVVVIKESDPSITEFDNNTLIVTTIPQSVADNETRCEWIVNGSTKGKVLNAPGYPARIPQPRLPDLYELRSTLDMGSGLFAKRDIKFGDLIFAERPLLVSPRAIYPLSQGPTPAHYTARQYQQVKMFEYENLLEKTIGRSSPQRQADFRALHNAHTGDGSGPLLGIIRTNGYGIDNLYDGSDQTALYGAVCKIGSRINHGCMPNVMPSFKLNSFSMQFYAIRDIKAGEQLLYSYCEPDCSLAQRQASLAPYGFVCKCPACVNATPETDKLRETFGTQIALLKKKQASSTGLDEAAVENALRLEEAIVKEGLNVEFQYVTLLRVIGLAYAKLGKMAESNKYVVLVEAFDSFYNGLD